MRIVGDQSLPPRKYVFGDINYFKLVTFFFLFLKLALKKKKKNPEKQDSKEPVTPLHA